MMRLLRISIQKYYFKLSVEAKQIKSRITGYATTFKIKLIHRLFALTSSTMCENFMLNMTKQGNFIKVPKLSISILLPLNSGSVCSAGFSLGHLHMGGICPPPIWAGFSLGRLHMGGQSINWGDS